MAKINELNAGLELEIVDSFGELTFLRMKNPNRVQDEETGEWTDTDYRYVVQSSKQLSEETITIPVSIPLVELDFGDKVELKAPHIELFAFRNGRYTNNYIKITAEGIKKVTDVKATGNGNAGKANNDGKGKAAAEGN
ncbi:DUF961 family protein [Enterococcus sp. LJL90]